MVWMIPFLVSLVIFPLKYSLNPLFESIMPVIIAMSVVTFSYLYMKGIDKNYLGDSLIIGVSWLIISLIIDLILFLPASPMQMSFTAYFIDIGTTYLMIPVITLGFGYLLQSKS
jgi:hypothetical protein